MTAREAYEHGFLDKCAEFGIDPAAVKQAGIGSFVGKATGAAKSVGRKIKRKARRFDISQQKALRDLGTDGRTALNRDMSEEAIKGFLAP